MKVVGADGCPAGWVYVAIDGEGRWQAGLARTARELWQHFSDASLILLDVPIGLKEHGPDERRCDIHARRLLGPRRSSVFRVPCRDAVYASSYEEANRMNRGRTGKGLARQAWNIVRLIRQVDELLWVDEGARRVMRECHPELCFWAFNGGLPMEHPKTTAEGERARLEVLRAQFPAADEVVEDVTARYTRAQLGRDDVIDALAAAVTARGWPDRIASLPLQPESDSRGLRMEIVYGEVTVPSRESGTDRILDTL